VYTAMHESATSRLARSPTAACLAPPAAGLVPAPDRQRPGRHEGAVSQWMTRARDGGPEALRHRPHPGASSRLSPEQLARLPELLHRGAEAYGFRGQVWTRSRIAAVMQLAFSISYHPRHVSRLCQVIRWSPQKPARRARQRDEAAIARWREATWPAIKRGRKPSSRASSL
jgi:transposase